MNPRYKKKKAKSKMVGTRVTPELHKEIKSLGLDAPKICRDALTAAVQQARKEA